MLEKSLKKNTIYAYVIALGGGPMSRVYVTRLLPPKAVERLSDVDAVFFQEDRPIDRSSLLEGVKDAEGLICILTDTIDEDVMDAASGLRVISCCAAGVDKIDVDAATRRGILVTNTPDALTETTADLAWTLLLDAARRVSEGDRYIRQGRFVGWGPLLLNGVDVYGKTLGIVGAGRIGGAVARRATAFHMNILYHNRNRNRILEEDTGAVYVSFEELLERSDFVSLHTPLTPGTKNMFGENEFSMMKRSAVFINTARGGCHDEVALVEALRNGVIRAAGLDVFHEEPKVHPGLLELENVVLCPHLGSASEETRRRMALDAVVNLLDALNDRRPRYVVNPEVLRG